MVRKVYRKITEKNTLAMLLLFVSFSFVLTFIYLFEGLRTPLITTLVAIAAFYVSLNKHWLESDAIFRSLFDSFNERFNKLNGDLNEIKDKFKVDVECTLKSERNSNEVIQDYLNLCAEEYFWYKKGRIEKSIWDSWKEGIKYYLTAPPIYEYFKNQETEDKSYYGFFSEIKDFLKSS